MECVMICPRSQRSRPSVFLLALIVVLAADAVLGAAVTRYPRAVSQTGTTNANEIMVCHSATPCGWAVYIPFTRKVDFFMKNECECPKDLECLRTDDDLSVSAYVYRCRPENSNPGATS